MTKIPEAVVVDTATGDLWWRNSTSEMFTTEFAELFAKSANDECRPEHQTFKVFKLVPVEEPAPVIFNGPWPDEKRCRVPMVHADKSEARCVLHKDHQKNDSDHVDEHGHTAPVLVHQSTIEEARRVQEERNSQSLNDRVAATHGQDFVDYVNAINAPYDPH